MVVPLAKMPGYFRSAFSRRCWYLIVYVTNVCNQRCVMCYNRDMDEESADTLTVAEFEKIAPHFGGLFQLTLSGGEPTLRKELPDIIRVFNKKKPIPRITLPTNGQLPDRIEQMVSQICGQNPGSNINVALSLDGVGEVHDKIRNTPNAFERFTETMDVLNRMTKTYGNLSIVVASTISSLNVDNAEELIEYIASRPNPEIYGLMIARGDTKNKEATDVETGRFLPLLEKLKSVQRKKLGKFGKAWTDVYYQNRIKTLKTGIMTDPCRAGQKLLILSHNGFLWPCEILEWQPELFLPLEGGFCIGNVRNNDFDVTKMLSGLQAEHIYQYIQEGKCACSFECALLNNFALNPLNYCKALINLLKP